MVTGFLNHTLLPERSHGYEVTMTFISTGKGFILLEAQENKDWNPGVMQALPEGAMEGGGGDKVERDTEKNVSMTSLTERHAEPGSWGVETCLFRDQHLLGRCDAREACHPSAVCISVLSISGLLHSSSHRCPRVFCALCLLSLSVVEDSHTSLIEIFPFVCALLTFDILLDLLAEWPRGFSFCKKEKRKESSSEWEKHIQKQRKQQFNMHMNSAQWDPAYASELSRWHFVCDAWSSTVTAPLTWFTFDYLKQNRKSTQGE